MNGQAIIARIINLYQATIQWFTGKLNKSAGGYRLNHIAVIYDKEPYFAERLANYLNAAETFPFQVCAFTEEDELERYCMENEIEVLVVDERCCEIINRLIFKELIILSASGTKSDNNENQIYKYQGVETIIHEIMAYLSGSSHLSSVISRKKAMKIIAFYSPVKRALSTTMAIAMGQILAKNYKTLYISLESYSGLEKLLERNFNKDITDIMYYIQSGGGNIGMHISGIVEKTEGLDILPPAKNQNDLVNVSFDEWKRMLHQIESETDYEYVLLDLSDAIQGLFDVLLLSNRVVTCVDNDDVAISKIIQYENSLKESDYKEILVKTKKCIVPKQHRRNGEIRYLCTGELGEYVHNKLQDMMYEL